MKIHSHNHNHRCPKHPKISRRHGHLHVQPTKPHGAGRGNEQVSFSPELQQERSAASQGGTAPSWRDTLPENFRNYVADRAPDADNNQAAGILAMLYKRIRT